MGKNAEARAGSIYHYHRGYLSQLYTNLSIPNAICFSPDGCVAYFTDTTTSRLMQVEIDPDTALPTDEPRVFYDHGGGEGELNGAIVDANGNI